MPEWGLAVAAAVPGTILVVLLAVAAYLGYRVYHKYRSYSVNNHQRAGSEDIMMSESVGNSTRRASAGTSFFNPLAPVPEDEPLSGRRSRDRHRLSERSIFGSSLRSQKAKSPKDMFGASIESAGVWL